MVYTVDELKKIVAPIAEKYQLPAVYVFGSYARGEARTKAMWMCCSMGMVPSSVDFFWERSATLSVRQIAKDSEPSADCWNKRAPTG